MKLSILLRLFLGLGLAIFIFASALRASLDEILAPLPVAEASLASSAKMQPVRSVSKIQSLLDTAPPVEETYEVDSILVSDVHDAITSELAAHLRIAGDLTLVALRDLPDLSAYSQPFVVRLNNAPANLSRGNVLLRFQVENEKGVLGEWNVPFRAHIFSEVWYPRSQLRRGELATPSDFESRPVDLLAEPAAVPANLESLLRHEYSRDIVPGKPLKWTDLIERSLVRKGDVVEVSAVTGLLAITMRAIARQDGSDGDLILLRNIDSAKEFSARVIGENRVEVIF
ncbi:flagellar basal body P-ring formation chaperone FlgA [Pelagicoccus sp. SDUM812002]|uniref:flagellar basal body P-ring formation chaperone FlgA n=1 Tax=Pelagicoccus sp. SDUM812002 TaxID=3041266 RepID=UPI00280FA1C3|nr:flagellar basal body P-ring formation chaperone FlgA [Pelagicoccus sp. SDUM812002]MDQ8185965.1 flagellar basal body P-ring formation chaperone FlgA [Pelagicoccus sp. SDUM812002]